MPIQQESILFLRFGVALLIGTLIGMQREFSFSKGEEREHTAGIRTFALISLCGCASAFISDITHSILPLVAMIGVFGVIFAVTQYADTLNERSGITGEVSALIAFICGIMCYHSQLAVAAALGVMTTLLLSMKPELHGIVKSMSREDLFATLKFAVITAIILPILPNTTFGPAPFNEINPFKIWMLVILISGISFVGYVLIKVIGPSKGMGLTGLLGGLASSTALTLSCTQQSRQAQTLARNFALAITIAWTVMFGRIIVIVGVLNMPLAERIILPMLIPVAAGLVYCFWLYQKAGRADNAAEVSFANPFELWPAISFAVLVSVILIVSKFAQMRWGDSGVLVSSVLAGIADVDAISVSLAQLSLNQGGLDAGSAATGIVLAAATNTATKGLIVISMGSKGLRRYILPATIMMTCITLATIFII
jgi:uncharacterized membrane protein (DUF4010 family)